MTERIQELIDLYNLGIKKDVFFKMILHCNDGSNSSNKAYANNLKVEEWKELFTDEGGAKLSLDENQLNKFFEYMIKYYS